MTRPCGPGLCRCDDGEGEPEPFDLVPESDTTCEHGVDILEPCEMCKALMREFRWEAEEDHD